MICIGVSGFEALQANHSSNHSSNLQGFKLENNVGLCELVNWW